MCLVFFFHFTWGQEYFVTVEEAPGPPAGKPDQTSPTDTTAPAAGFPERCELFRRIIVHPLGVFCPAVEDDDRGKEHMELFYLSVYCPDQRPL